MRAGVLLLNILTQSKRFSSSNLNVVSDYRKKNKISFFLFRIFFNIYFQIRKLWRLFREELLSFSTLRRFDHQRFSFVFFCHQPITKWPRSAILNLGYSRSSQWVCKIKISTFELIFFYLGGTQINRWNNFWVRGIQVPRGWEPLALVFSSGVRLSSRFFWITQWYAVKKRFGTLLIKLWNRTFLTGIRSIMKYLFNFESGGAHDGDGPRPLWHPERRETQTQTLGAVQTSTHSRAQKVESSAAVLFARLLLLQGIFKSWFPATNELPPQQQGIYF